MEETMDSRNLKSQKIPGAREKQAEVGRYYRRTLLNALGVDDKEFKKPLVAIVNGWSEISPGHFHLKAIADAAKQGVIEAGGHPAEFGAAGLCDGLSVGSLADRYSLPYRDATALYIESMLEANLFDAAIFLPTCDKVVPSFLLAAAKVNIPSILVTGGYMEPGEFNNKPVVMSDIVEGFGALEQGKIAKADFEYMLENTCCGPGACPLMATANTVCSVAEGLGMTLPGNATLPAISSNLVKMAREAGRQVLKLLEKGLTPSKIMTREAIENAIRLTLAIGGSTNLILHIPAIAHLLGYQIDLELWDKLSGDTPLVCKIKPSDPSKTMVDLAKAGGIQSVLKSLESKISLKVMTVTGKTLGENLKSIHLKKDGVIRPIDNPFSKQGGLAVLKGNLAPEGAIVKQSAVPKEMMKFEGPAIVFDSEEEAIEGLMKNKINDGQMVVLRYEGPKGGPGMRQLQFFMNILCGMKRETKVGFITDGRFSGTNWGLAIGHVCPEAMDGGAIALVEDGDRIRVDISKREINLLLSEEQLKRRAEGWKKPKAKAKGGLLGLYAATTSSAAENGACMIDP
jgi:dihydroxy-acid dehydratase